jgi:pyrrolidone-carboxylate peptidase
MRTLLTGFGPFGAIAHNPSARIVEQLARGGSPGHRLTCRVLPVSFARAEAEIGSLLKSLTRPSSIGAEPR